MLNITIISVGKLSEPYWQEAAEEYLKRLKPYVKLKIIEIQEEKVDTAQRQKILKIEAEKINKLIPGDSVVVSLDGAGAEYISTDWADKLEDWSKFGKSIVFIIGGPLGLSTEILSKSRQLLSLSKMTFTHQMARVILLEQIYRGITIQKGKAYHY